MINELIDAAESEWRILLCVCFTAKGGQSVIFEHTLFQYSSDRRSQNTAI